MPAFAVSVAASMSDAQSPKVSVAMITYNHEKYIAQAIESALKQEVSFNYEIVIGEDCSQDGTRDLVLEYQSRFPQRIQVILQERNLGHLGKHNLVKTLTACRGQYVALLEGDDYWTSPNKLQKQAQFLDQHAECAVCFHNVLVVQEDGSSAPFPYCPASQKQYSGLEDLLIANFAPTCSVMFRRGLFGFFPDWFYELKMSDWLLNILNAEHGSIGYLPELLGVYRVHSEGVWSARNLSERSLEEIRAFELIDRHLRYQYRRLIKAMINKRLFYLALAADQESDVTQAKQYLKKCFAHCPGNKYIPGRQILRLFLKLYFPDVFLWLKGCRDRLRNSSRRLV